MGRPFAPIPDLLAHAESITKTLAICVRCGNPAKHTQRLRGSEDLIVVGASDMYEAPLPPLLRAGHPQADRDGLRQSQGAREKTRADGRYSDPHRELVAVGIGELEAAASRKGKHRA